MIAAKGDLGVAETVVNIPIVIDSTLTNDFRLTVNVSGGLGAASLVLLNPDATITNTVDEKLESDGSVTRDFWVSVPEPGTWRLMGTKQVGTVLRYVCDAKMSDNSVYLALEGAEWSDEEGELGVFASVLREAPIDGAVVSVRLALTNGVVMNPCGVRNG